MKLKLRSLIVVLSIVLSGCAPGLVLPLRLSVDALVKENIRLSGDNNCVLNRSFSDKQMESFKSRTLVFFYSKQDAEHKEQLRQYQNYLPKVWTITPVIFAPESDLLLYQKSDNYVCLINDTITVANEDLKGPSLIHTSYYKKMYFLYRENAAKKYDTIHVFNYGMYMRIGDDDNPFIPTSENYFNYNPLSVCTQLQALNNTLTAKQERIVYTEDIKSDSLRKLLSKDTLYIPYYLVNKLTQTLEDNSSIMKKYPFNYKICSVEDINNIFIDNKRGRLFADYALPFNTSQRLVIYDTKTGAVIYCQQLDSPVELKLTNQDIKDITETFMSNATFHR